GSRTTSSLSGDVTATVPESPHSVPWSARSTRYGWLAIALGTVRFGKLSVACPDGASVKGDPVERPVITSVPSLTVIRDAAGSSTKGDPPAFRTSRVTSIVCPGRVWLGARERATYWSDAGGSAWSVSD